MNFAEKMSSRYGLSFESIATLTQHAQRIEFGKKATIIAEAERDDYVWFVESGSVRGYVMRDDKCVIRFFAFEGDAASLTLGVLDNSCASVTVETMEQSTLLRITRRQMDELFAQSAELASWGRRVVERTIRFDTEYFLDYAWRDKSEQYLLLLRQYPELLQRVSLKDLAAYLFLTPQTLSRIRAELK